MSAKARLSASVDAHLLAAAEESVSRGAAGSVSAWVNDALRLKIDQERRLAALAAFIDEYERAHGVITEDEMRQARRRVRARAAVIRGRRRRPGGRRRTA
jgi:Arc/MetJ-type ribon-helix-helix transcriptional regulator